MKSLSVEQSRQIDWIAKDQGHIPGIVLMENAGRGITECLLKRKPKSVLVCCGRGNNGGDGFVIARHLDQAGIPVRVILFANPRDLLGDAFLNYSMIYHSDIPLDLFPKVGEEGFRKQLEEVDWVVDALVGTGQKGSLRPPFDMAAKMINQSGKKVLAVDIPSGMDADTGEITEPTIKANLTVTMVTPKCGFSNPKAKANLGELEIVGIGLPRCWQPS